MDPRLKASLVRLVKSRVTLGVGLTLVLCTAVQAAVLGFVDLRARENGGMIAALGGAKVRLLVAAFPDQTVQYLQSFPLCLVGAGASLAALVPLLLIAIGAAGLAPKHQTNRSEERASRPIDDFVALWICGFALCAACVLTVVLVTFVVARPGDSLAFLAQSAALSGLSAAFMLPATSIVVAIGALTRSRWVVFLAGVVFLVLTDAKGLPASLAWLAPRTYENYAMSASWGFRVAGLLGLSLWGGVGLLIASRMTRRRSSASEGARIVQQIETVGRTG